MAQLEPNTGNWTVERPFALLLVSEAYGEESFTYESWDDMLAGLGRLFREAQRCYEEDGVERDLIVRVPNHLVLARLPPVCSSHGENSSTQGQT